MEIFFLLIAIILSISMTYMIGRSFESHKSLINTYKQNEELFVFHFFVTLMMVVVLFITLCAFNNTFWHLPYLKTIINM